jgi:hypothetical protein
MRLGFMLTFTGSKAILKTQTTGTEKPDAPLRGMRWQLNVPALQPSYFNAQPGLLKVTSPPLVSCEVDARTFLVLKGRVPVRRRERRPRPRL